jgi:hypothetical protein
LGRNVKLYIGAPITTTSAARNSSRYWSQLTADQ